MISSRFYFKCLAFIFGFFILLWLVFLFTPTVNQKDGVVYYLRPGLSKRAVINALSDQGVIRHPYLFYIYAVLTPQSHLKTGEYYFPHAATPAGIWHQVTTGSGLYYRPFTIIPGWTFKQLQTALQNNAWLKKTKILNAGQTMQQLGYTTNLSPEGRFYPETYYFTRNDTDISILTRADQLMKKQLAAAWQNRAPNLPYQNPYEALIAASMIEREGYLDNERPIIASVLVNRLRKGMPLQIDATVIYALGERYDGKIYKDNLQMDSVYNTYRYKGLPPTPIAFPSQPSLQAALHPQTTNYYYYVAREDGSHQFSETLDAHHAAVARQKAINQSKMGTT